MTTLLVAAHWLMSRLLRTAAMSPGKRSVVHAKAGAPRAAKAAAFFASHTGAPSSLRASSATNCVPDVIMLAARFSISALLPPS